MSARKFMALAPALLLGACVNLGAGKPPARLLTLTSDARAPAGATIAATPANTILVIEPVTPRELAVTRVPVAQGAGAIAYLKDATWVERPARLFRALLAETIRARGRHLVLEDDQGDAPAATHLSGRLEAMGYDAASRTVTVRYDALRTGGDGVITARRFEASEANIAPDAASVAPALNRAANVVAGQVADWVG